MAPVATALGRMSLQPPAKIDAVPTAKDLGYLALVACDAELTRAEVLELQKRLASLGINAGPLDGIVGPRTMAGLQRYQELKGLATTGKVDRQMLKLLQQDPGSSATLEARAQ